jgi:hypothetical protein
MRDLGIRYEVLGAGNVKPIGDKASLCAARES